MKCRGNHDTTWNIPRSITFSPLHFMLYRGKSRYPLGQCICHERDCLLLWKKTSFFYKYKDCFLKRKDFFKEFNCRSLRRKRNIRNIINDVTKEGNPDFDQIIFLMIWISLYFKHHWCHFPLHRIVIVQYIVHYLCVII